MHIIFALHIKHQTIRLSNSVAPVRLSFYLSIFYFLTIYLLLFLSPCIHSFCELPSTSTVSWHQLAHKVGNLYIRDRMYHLGSRCEKQFGNIRIFVLVKYRFSVDAHQPSARVQARSVDRPLLLRSGNHPSVNIGLQEGEICVFWYCEFVCFYDANRLHFYRTPLWRERWETKRDGR